MKFPTDRPVKVVMLWGLAAQEAMLPRMCFACFICWMLLPAKSYRSLRLWGR